MDPWEHPIFHETLQEWQDIVDLVVRLLGVRAGLIMRARDDNIAVLVSSRNAGNPYEVGEEEKLIGSGLYCERVIATQDKLLVPNALKSDQWRNNPDIKRNMVSYLGFPIRLPGRRPFGTLCVLDDKENHYSPDVIDLMEKLRDLVESHLRLDERLLLQENTRLLEQLQDELAERARVEAELRASEERYRMLMMLSPDGVSVADQTGHIWACNEQFARMHGYACAADAVGRDSHELTRPEALAGLRREVAAAFARGESVARDIEVEVLRRDGSSFWAEYSVTPVPWPDAPSGVAYLSNIRDITQRKAQAEDLERHRSHLEELVQERTAALESEIVERKAAQAALESSQASLAEAERIALVGSWERDLATGHVYWSDGIYRIFGIDPATPSARTQSLIFKAAHPEDLAAVEAAFAHTLQTSEPFGCTYRIIVPSGETRVVHAVAEAEHDAEGNLVRLRGIVQDITAQEEVRKALDQRIRELSMLQDLGHPVSLEFSLDESLHIYLERIVALPGVDMAQAHLLRDGQLRLAGVCARRMSLELQTQLAAAGVRLSALAAQEGQPVCSWEIKESQHRSAPGVDAADRHALVAVPMHGGEAIIGALVLGAENPDAFAARLPFLETAADLVGVRLQNALLHQAIQHRAAGLEAAVAERTRELQTERDRTQAILETLSESVVVTDLEGQVLFMNPATTELTGLARDSLLGQPLWRQWSSRLPAETWTEMLTALQEGRFWKGEIVSRRADGSAYTAELALAPLLDAGPESRPVGGVWVQRDVTALKDAARLKDQFVSNVSHELRTPLSVIALTCDNLRAFEHRLSEAERREMLEDVHEQVGVLSHLIEDILRISQIEGGYAPAERGFVDLAALVRDEADRQRPLVGQRSQRLTVTADEAVAVVGSEQQLRQVVRNLLDNAIKYTPLGGRISCTCEIRSGFAAAGASVLALEAGEWAVVEVTDGGIGISAEDLPYVFDRFFRVNAQSDVPGTGLGLPIAQELVKLHGGWIAVDSTPGQGSTFTAYLPLAGTVTP